MAIALTHRNSATVDTIRTWVEDHLVGTLTKTRKERLAEIEPRWLHLWNIWDVKLDQPSYLGRSQVYLPAARMALETWLMALWQGLFPQTERFRVEAMGPNATVEVEARWNALQRQYFDKDLKIETAMELFLRQYLTFGTAIYRHVWDEREEVRRFYEEQPKNAPLDTEAEERRFHEKAVEDLELSRSPDTVLRLVEKLVKVKCGPAGRVVDLFHFYVKPISAPSLHEAESCWEDLEFPLEHLIAQHARWMDPEIPEYGRVYDHPDWDQIIAQKGALSQEMLSSRQERWQRLGIDADPNRAYGELEKKGHVQLTEQFWRGEIPGALDEQGKEYGIRDWHIVWVNDTWAVRINPNPFYDQMRPWVDARMFPTVNHYYGQGVLHAIAAIQYYLNDIANLTLDNIVMALSPIFQIDEEEVQVAESLKIAPGAKWFVKSGGVNMLQIQNQAQVGMATMNMMQGFAHDFSGANAATQGQPPARGRGRVAQTASGYAQLQAVGSQGFQFAIGRLEQQLMVPLMERHYQLMQQFQTEQQTIQRLGEDGVAMLTEKVGFEDIYGTYRYTWLGSTAVREKMAMVMGLQSLPQLLQMLPPDVQQAFDGIEYIKKLLTDGYGVTWADKIFRLPKPDQSIAPAIEHDVMAARRDMHVSPSDDDDLHLQEHGMALLQDERFRRDTVARQLLIEHRTAHEMQKQAKQQMQQQQMMQQAMAQLMPPQEELGAEQTGSMPNPMNGTGDMAPEPVADMMRGMQ